MRSCGVPTGRTPGISASRSSASANRSAPQPLLPPPPDEGPVPTTLKEAKPKAPKKEKAPKVEPAGEGLASDAAPEAKPSKIKKAKAAVEKAGKVVGEIAGAGRFAT